MGVVRAARQTGDFSDVPVDLIPNLHRLLVRDTRKQYAAMLRAVADPAQRPVAFHCSHGVHRSGTAAAILLSALGVTWETIREDDLLSDTYRKDEVEKRLEQLRLLAAENQGDPPEQVDTAKMRAFYVREGAYIDATLEAAVEQCGSVENCLRDGLGFMGAEIERLRTELLE